MSAFFEPFAGGDDLKEVSPGVVNEEGGFAVGAGEGKAGYSAAGVDQGSVGSRNVVGFDAGGEDAGVAEHRRFGRECGFSAGVLPDFEAAAAPEADGEKGVP